MAILPTALINTQYKRYTFIKVKTLTSCSFNMADISTSSLAASTWFTLEIEIGIAAYKQNLGEIN